MKQRLDAWLVAQGKAPTRSQADSMIRLGDVRINGQVVTKSGTVVRENDRVVVADRERYVSRAGLKLASVAEALRLDFRDKTVLDVGSSTGGFTDFALQHGAKKVFAVDVGTEQMHPSLRENQRVELYEKTDIRNVKAELLLSPLSGLSRVISRDNSLQGKDEVLLSEIPDIIVIDVSFISLREVLPHIVKDIASSTTQIVAMVKPQFEAGKGQVNKGVIKNDRVRRQILADFEAWSRQFFVIIDKSDSAVTGQKGNQERFYLIRPLQ